MSENSPSYLVADTNCFIDHLQFVEKLLDSKDFNIVVPLIGKEHVYSYALTPSPIPPNCIPGH